MSKAKAWIEQRYFVSCPKCEGTIDLGPDAFIQEGDTETCTQCGEEFELEDAES